LADIKFTIDEILNPAFAKLQSQKQLDELTIKLEAMVQPTATILEKLTTLKKFIYEPGPWNDNIAFGYDHIDPFGKDVSNQILGQYMTRRLGNCVSMPILFMLLGNRIGLNMTLAVSPGHSFIKFTDGNGRIWNLETTSGGGFTRDEKYRRETPMTDQAVKKGTYLKSLSHDEVVAMMATAIAAEFVTRKQPKEAIVVTGVLLQHYPQSAELLILQAHAYAKIIEQEVIPYSKQHGALTPELQDYADAVFQRNQIVFNEALAIGYSETQGKEGVQP
jgi:regulator of sirC expression with transglutaminase-like and TPR domain